MGAFVGYTFSEGVDIDPVSFGGQIFDHVGPSSALSYCFSVDVFVTENAQIGFQFGQQASKLKGDGPGVGAIRLDFGWGQSGAKVIVGFGVFEKADMQRARVR